MRFILFVMLLFLVIQGTATAQDQSEEVITIGDYKQAAKVSEAILSGRITNANNGEPMEGVTIYIENLKKGTATDSAGRYNLPIAPGKYEIRFQFLGMRTVVRQVIIYSSGELNIAMREKPFDMDEVIVEARQTEDNVLGVIPGIENISINDVRELPAFLGEVDVVNSLVKLPGVNTIGEGASGFNVRGGRVDQNLILMDGAQLFNSSHVLGLFSVFNPDVTESFTLYKGHIPARFGGRLSSVLDVNMKNGSFEEYSVNGGVGIAAARFLVEGPISKGKTSFLLGGRSSYSDWILKLVKDTDVRASRAFFYDVNPTLTHQFNEDNRLRLSLYGSHDFFRFSDQFGYTWNNRFANLVSTNILTEQLISESSIVYGTYTTTSFVPSGIEAFELENGISYFKVKENVLYKANENHTVNAGIEFNTFNNESEKLRPYNAGSTVENEKVEKDQGREFSFYAGDDISLLPGLLVSLGVRYTRYQNFGPAQVFSYQPGIPKRTETITDTTQFSSGEVIKSYDGFEPRLSARFSLTPSSSIKASYNKTRQYIHLISNTTSPTPADIWQVSNTHIPAKSANNYSIGLFKNFKDGVWETSAEIYYRTIDNLVEYTDFAELFLNEHLETELLVGQGRSYGGEVSIKKTVGGWTGWLSYALSRTFVKVDGETPEARINQGDWFPSSYDQPHNIDLVVKRRLGERSSFSFNFTYRTGRPITTLTSSYVDNPTSIPIYSERNEYRIPDYIRLDISFTIAENIWKGRTVDPNRNYKDNMSISFYNVLSRDNAFSVFYRRPLGASSAIPKAHKLSVLGAVIPAVTYNFSF